MRLIDADALYAALMEKSTVIARGTGRNCLALACEAVAGMVQEAPTIDAVPARHGKWLHPEEDDDDYHSVSCSCSVCGWKFNLYEDDIDGAPYCAMCGAKMEPVSPLYQADEAEP